LLVSNSPIARDEESGKNERKKKEGKHGGRTSILLGLEGGRKMGKEEKVDEIGISQYSETFVDFDSKVGKKGEKKGGGKKKRKGRGGGGRVHTVIWYPSTSHAGGGAKRKKKVNLRRKKKGDHPPWA